MGFCRDPFGRISVESRRESFVIHTDYGYDGSGEHSKEDGALWKHWREVGHPEFLNADLDDLISALVNLRDAKQRKS